MSALKIKPGEITDLSKHRKQKEKGKTKPHCEARASVALCDVPAVTVRRKDGKTAALVNLPRTEAGAELVLFLIRASPDACLMTDDGMSISLRDIAALTAPERDAAAVETARADAAAEPMPFRHLSVLLGSRSGESVGLFNIPDCPEGTALFHGILQKYSLDHDGQPTGYTLFTTDYGYLPVHELAKANQPAKRGSED